MRTTQIIVTISCFSQHYLFIYCLISFHTPSARTHTKLGSYCRLATMYGPAVTVPGSRLRLKCDGTRAETRFRLAEKRTSPFKSAGVSVQSTTVSRGVRISGSNAGYTMFRGSVKSTGYPLQSTFSSALPLPSVTVCHHIPTGLYHVLGHCCFLAPLF